jgi:hypothetical protein
MEGRKCSLVPRNFRIQWEKPHDFSKLETDLSWVQVPPTGPTCSALRAKDLPTESFFFHLEG